MVIIYETINGEKRNILMKILLHDFDVFISPTDTFFAPVREVDSLFFAFSLNTFDLGVVLTNDAEEAIF